MPPVSKTEMLQMVDKWQEVEESWATENGCEMPHVSAVTLAQIRYLLGKHFEKQAQAIDRIRRANAQTPGNALVNLRYVLRNLIVLAGEIEENGKDEPTCDGANFVAWQVGKTLAELEAKYIDPQNVK